MLVLDTLARALGATLLACMIPCISASAFLRAKTPEEMRQVAREMIESTLLSELAMDSGRIRNFEEEIRPMYLALPKNELGTLEPTAVRYALHRYFVQKHGWYMKGLEPAGQSWNSTSPSSILKSRVPAFIQSLFEERLHGEGMGLHEVAVFAATLSDFVHNEALSDVMDLFGAFGLSTTMPVMPMDAIKVIEGYVLQLLDGVTKIKALRDFHNLRGELRRDFPAFDDFFLWVEDVRKTNSLDRSQRSFHAEETTLGHVIEEVQELTNRLGAFQDIECRSFKAALADMEYKNTGRVLLSDFYREGLKGEFLFVEHVDYLRKLGALDESDPQHPSVIIVNYLASPANCLASTSFHSVCCFDECEGLMGHLERSIAAPAATPGHIAGLVAGLRSDSVDAPRILPASLVSRLGEIADHHDGLVPLHGRLFAQWMHHAYPLECPYPHAAGTTQPLTPDEWLDESGARDMRAPEAERFAHINAVASHEKADELPWSVVEELVVRDSVPKRAWLGQSMVRKIAALGAVLAFLVPLARASSALAMPSGSKSEKCHLV